MKHTLFSSGTGWRSRRGVALITVLILVVLITSIIVGFLATSGLEQTAARSYKATSAARLLGDTAVNLVEGQINEATSQGMSYAWASQPGAIRVYNHDGTAATEGAGSLFQIYRLYSALNLTTSKIDQMDTSATAPGTNDMPPTTWSSDPAMWVDLNAPAYDEAGNEHYPIFDAGVAANVDGFSLGAPTASGVSSGVGATATALGATATQVPMPVTWLYVLQNGEIIPPDAGGSTVVQFTHAPIQPSTADPIVGRIAFWTDDDTCKVNINTAGGDGIGNPASGQTTDPTPIANATFWDTPHYCAPDDVALAQYQPASGEFQRYPGHPATVALHNIINGLGWLSLDSQQFYGLLPRYTFGGSEGGTVGVIAAGAAGAIPLKTNPQNRLYTSVGEMLFNYDRSKSVINGDNTTTRQQIETANFFLTAHSTAPEVTLSGQPRVSIWPVIDLTAVHGQQRTPIDKLLAFAATNSGNAYYFTRSDPTSSTTDIGLARNQQLLNYLDYFTSQVIPGYGGSFDAKYSQLGARQILTEIFDYIRTINICDTTQQTATSATNSVEYAQPWITTGAHYGMYEVAPSVVSNTALAWNTQGFGIFPRLNEAAIQFVALGRGAYPGASPPATAVPAIPIDSALYTSSLNLLAAGDSGTNPNDLTGSTSTNTIMKYTTTSQYVPPGNTVPGTGTGAGCTTAVQAFLLLSFTNPAQMLICDGTTTEAYSIDPYVWVEVSGLNGFDLNGHPLNFTKDDSMIIGNNQGSLSIRDDWDRVDFWQMLFERLLGPGAANPSTNNPFYSQIIPIEISPTTGTGTMTLTFSGAPITIKLYDKSGAHLVQTYTIDFPSTSTFNVPTVVIPTTEPAPTPPAVATGPTVGVTPSIAADDRWSDANYAALLKESPNNSLEPNPNQIFIVGDGLSTGDVVQSMVLSSTWSDARLLAISSVPSAAFVTDPNWGKQNFAYGFFYSDGPYYTNQSLYHPGLLNPNVTYPVVTSPPNVAIPWVTPTLAGVNLQTADWDTGLGSERDGPWINKADEGDIFSLAGNQNIPYFTTVSDIQSVGASFFSPNREVPSPGMFGSLSTGIDPTGGSSPTGWQTLLFRPCPGHEGEKPPEDHLMLDLFWMPDAEPYAISEQFCSAGKINLNYQIQPFTYITRSTALRAVFNSEKIAQVNANQGPYYKLNSGVSGHVGGGMASPARLALDVNQTLTQFQDKFDGTNNSGNPLLSGKPDIFHSASQICDMYLVPEGSTVQQFESQWYDGKTYGLVGDNVRERPYTNIYGQITTKSNTYTVYYTVQSLKNTEPASLQNQWSETQGTVLGEYRGSTTMERYIDPSQTLPDFANVSNLGKYSLDGSVATDELSDYKWRVVNSHQFAP